VLEIGEKLCKKLSKKTAPATISRKRGMITDAIVFVCVRAQSALKVAD
jgi:hypothetical protein